MRGKSDPRWYLKTAQLPAEGSALQLRLDQHRKWSFSRSEKDVVMDARVQGSERNIGQDAESTS